MSKFFLIGSNPLVRFELEPGFNTVGRNPTNDLRLKDATISSFHCELVVAKDETVTVHDLGSTNGTFVNGNRIEKSPLPVQAALRVGSIELRLERIHEAPEVRIAVPKLPVEAAPKSTVLPDGYSACINHPQAYASHQCTRCQKTFCSDCAKPIGLAGGGKERVFCPSCSAPCERLPLPPGAASGAKRKKSILGRLTQTLRLRAK